MCTMLFNFRDEYLDKGHYSRKEEGCVLLNFGPDSCQAKKVIVLKINNIAKPFKDNC